jgi:RimJ/RimL family protein N-acetyltransferase
MSYISMVTSPVALRRATLDDAPALAALLCPEISCWLADWPDSMDEALAREQIARELKAAEDGTSLPMVIELAAPGQAPVVAGWFRLRLAPHDQDLAVMTCWLGRDFQGLGAAKGAVAEALKIVTPELGASRVGAYSMRTNKRSIRVLEECGLRFAGERTVPVPARGRVEVVFSFERSAQGGLVPVQDDAMSVATAA